MTHGLYLRTAYTFGHAYDDGQDALVAGRPAAVQNGYSTASERGPSSTDQRHRFVLSVIDELRRFGRDHGLLSKLFNDWKVAGVLTIGSGRPVDAKVYGDPTGTETPITIDCPVTGETHPLARTMPPLTYDLLAVSTCDLE